MVIYRSTEFDVAGLPNSVKHHLGKGEAKEFVC